MEIIALIILITLIWAIIKIITKIYSFIAGLFKLGDIQRINIGSDGSETINTLDCGDFVGSEDKEKI